LVDTETDHTAELQAAPDRLGANLNYDEGWEQWDDMKRYGPMSRHTRRLIWAVIGKLHFRSVLDVGCGQGSPLEEIARRRPGVELAGVDFSPRAVELARQRMPEAKFSVLDLTKGALDSKFDLIICTDVLEHIPDDRAALRNMRAMCGRWCLVSTIQGRMRDYERQVGHVRNYRYGELRAKMEEAGFRVCHQIDWGFPLYSPLYREVLRYFPSAATTGEFGWKRRLLSEMLYYMFLVNASKFGDYVFCLAEAR
jgi:SAM-dependent methyltransferase